MPKQATMNSRVPTPAMVVYLITAVILIGSMINPFDYTTRAWMLWWLGVCIVAMLWVIALVVAFLVSVRAGCFALCSAPAALFFSYGPVAWCMGWWMW